MNDKANKQLVHAFLASINNKYNEFLCKESCHFKNVHQQIFTHAFERYTIDSLLHVIECCISMINIKKTFTNCLACSENDNIKTQMYIAINRENMAVFFNCYYLCPLIISLELFSRLKVTVYSNDGMHLFDLCRLSLDHFNMLREQNVLFLGNIYNQEPCEALVETITRYSDHFKCAMYGLVGTVSKPQHFYGIFIYKKVIYIYNSCLGDKPDNLVAALPQYQVKTNTFQNQYDNELCGFFALYFLNSMAQSQDLSKTFESFNKKENMDKQIEFVEQFKYIYPCTDKYKCIQWFLDSWRNRV